MKVDYTGTNTVADAAAVSQDDAKYILKVFVDNAITISADKKVVIGCAKDSCLAIVGVKPGDKIRQSDPEGSRAAIRSEATKVPKKNVNKLKAPSGATLDDSGVVQFAFDLVTESTKGKKFAGKVIVVLWVDPGESFAVFAVDTSDDGTSCSLSV